MKKRNEMKAPEMGVLMYDVKQVAAVCNLGVSTVWKLAKKAKERGDGSFPLPYYFGARVARWRAEDVKAWVKALGMA